MRAVYVPSCSYIVCGVPRFCIVPFLRCFLVDSFVCSVILRGFLFVCVVSLLVLSPSVMCCCCCSSVDLFLCFAYIFCRLSVAIPCSSSSLSDSSLLSWIFEAGLGERTFSGVVLVTLVCFCLVNSLSRVGVRYVMFSAPLVMSLLWCLVLVLRFLAPSLSLSL